MQSAVFTTSKTKETSRCRWGLGTCGAQVPRERILLAQSLHLPNSSWPFGCPHAAYSGSIVKFRDLAQRRYLVVNRWPCFAFLILISAVSFLRENLSLGSCEVGSFWDHSKVDCPRAQEHILAPSSLLRRPLHCENTSRQINCPGNEMVSDSQIPCIARIKLCISGRYLFGYTITN